MEDYFYMDNTTFIRYNTLNGGIDMLVKTDRYISFFPSLGEPSRAGSTFRFFLIL